jgi:hypothetical protein
MHRGLACCLGYGAEPRALGAPKATAQAIVKRGFACYYNMK